MSKLIIPPPKTTNFTPLTNTTSENTLIKSDNKSQQNFNSPLIIQPPCEIKNDNRFDVPVTYKLDNKLSTQLANGLSQRRSDMSALEGFNFTVPSRNFQPIQIKFTPIKPVSSPSPVSSVITPSIVNPVITPSIVNPVITPSIVSPPSPISSIKPVSTTSILKPVSSPVPESSQHIVNPISPISPPTIVSLISPKPVSPISSPSSISSPDKGNMPSKPSPKVENYTKNIFEIDLKARAQAEQNLKEKGIMPNQPGFNDLFKQEYQKIRMHMIRDTAKQNI